MKIKYGTVLKIEYQPDKGRSINDCLKEALKLAKKCNTTVFMIFNGTEFRVENQEDVDKQLQNYFFNHPLDCET